MRRVTKYSMSRLVMVGLTTLVVGAAAGWLAGRASLEKTWSTGEQPLTQLTVERLLAGDPDPVPTAGTLIMPEKPYTRANAEMTRLTANDPVRVRVAAIGNGNDGAELHVDVENHATCTIRELGGVVTGYDSTGKSAKLNLHGEHFVAFTATEQKLEPGAHGVIAQKLRYPETAALAVARVDSYACSDGTRWTRQ